MADIYHFEDTTVATVGSLNKVYTYLKNKNNTYYNNIIDVLRDEGETRSVITSITDAKKSIEEKLDDTTNLSTQISTINSGIQEYLDGKLTDCLYKKEDNTIGTASNTLDKLSLTNTNDNALTLTGLKLTESDVNSTNSASTASVIPALYVQGGIQATSGILGEKLYNAVWNDISDAITVQEDLIPEPGYCYYYDGEKYNKTNKYCTKGVLGIHSDTAGFKVGKKHISNELDIAIGGYVLAHVDKEYKSGTPLTCTKNGYLTKMKRIDAILFPERLVATFWKPETLEEWGSTDEKVAVNGRCWVKVK